MLIAVRNVKFLLSLMVADQYTAKNVILNEDRPEDIRLIS